MVKVVRASQVDIDAAVQALRDGDLVAFPTETVYGLGANAQNPAAVRKMFEERGLTLPPRFEVPDHKLWSRGYAAEARRSLLETAGTLEEALEVVAPFVNPLLDGSAKGRWNPELGAWV